MNGRKAMLQAHIAEGGVKRRSPVAEQAEEQVQIAPGSQTGSLSGPVLSSPGNVMALQRTVGNQVVQRLLQRDALEEEQDEKQNEGATDTTLADNDDSDDESEAKEVDDEDSDVE